MTSNQMLAFQNPPEDMMILCACSSGERAKDERFLGYWLMKFGDNFQTDDIRTVANEVNMMFTSKGQRPTFKAKLRANVRNGIYR